MHLEAFQKVCYFDVKGREVYENELSKVLELDLHLHEETIPEMSEPLENTWNMIIQDKNHHIIVKEINGK